MRVSLSLRTRSRYSNLVLRTSGETRWENERAIQIRNVQTRVNIIF